MRLGTEVGLGPGDIVFDRDPALPRKGAQQAPPHFSARLLWPNGRPSRQLLSSCYQTQRHQNVKILSIVGTVGTVI